MKLVSKLFMLIQNKNKKKINNKNRRKVRVKVSNLEELKLDHLYHQQLSKHHILENPISFMKNMTFTQG